MNKNNIIITIKKELRSIFRDKKTITMILCFPLIIAFLIFLYGFMENNMTNEDKLSLVGVNYNVSDIEKNLLSKNGLEGYYEKDSSKLKELCISGKFDAYILYDKDINKYTIYSSYDNSTSTTVSLARNYLDMYNQIIGDSNLLDKGIDPSEVYNNFSVDIKSIDGKDYDSSEMLLTLIMNMTFIYIIASIALATINMATSAIAVEKENGTLETILTLPITTKELVLGKYGATTIIGIFASLIGFFITLLSFGIGSRMFDIYKDINLTFSTILLGIIVCILASFLLAALSIFVTSSAKSYKEAQAKGQIVQLACLLPMVFTFLNFKVKELYYIVPILNHSMILMDLYSKKISYINLLLTIISTIIYSFILINIMIKKFKSEKVLFDN